MIYCYLRVSSLAQDEQNQRVGVLRKASELNVSIDKYYIDKVSGTTDPDKRNLGRLLKVAKAGDVIIVSELSRFGRRLFMLFRILESLLKKACVCIQSKRITTLTILCRPELWHLLLVWLRKSREI